MSVTISVDEGPAPSVPSPKQKTIFLLNPNSSQEMSQGMVESIRNSPLSNCRSTPIRLVSVTAAPDSPASINNAADIEQSTASVTQSSTLSRLLSPGGVLVACYSVHPLVDWLARRYPDTPVTGIFEASIHAAVAESECWGIVTTAKWWEEHLAEGVRKVYTSNDASLGDEEELNRRAPFGGVESTGLNAGDFHDVDEGERDERLKAATGRLIDRGVRCIVMGCAGMTGLEGIIRRACVERLGEEGEKVVIIDPVLAGVEYIQQSFEANDIPR